MSAIPGLMYLRNALLDLCVCVWGGSLKECWVCPPGQEFQEVFDSPPNQIWRLEKGEQNALIESLHHKSVEMLIEKLGGYVKTKRKKAICWDFLQPRCLYFLHSDPQKQKPHCRGMAPNGLPNYIMAPVWKCLHLTKDL